MKKTKIGFLPLYVELYDLTCPQMRPKDVYKRQKKRKEEKHGKKFDIPNSVRQKTYIS